MAASAGRQKGAILFGLDVDQIQSQDLQRSRQRLAAMQLFSGQGTSAFRYWLHTGAVSLAEHKLQAAEPNSLGHINCPDARPTAHVEDAGVPMLRNGRLVQLVAPCYRKQFVVDVHAVLLGLCVGVSAGGEANMALRVGPAYLVARVHVDASSEAMIPTAIFQVVAVLGGHGQSGSRVSSRCAQCAEHRRTERGGAVHSPIRCHRHHWSSLASRNGASGAGESLNYSEKAVSAGARGRAGRVCVDFVFVGLCVEAVVV